MMALESDARRAAADPTTTSQIGSEPRRTDWMCRLATYAELAGLGAATVEEYPAGREARIRGFNIQLAFGKMSTR
jgi:hypothetical protein